MIKIIAKFSVKPEEVAEFITCIKPLIEGSNQEEGCISYALHQDIHTPHILTMIEEWKDQEAIDLHNQTEHFTTIVPQLSARLTQPTEVNLYKELN